MKRAAGAQEREVGGKDVVLGWKMPTESRVQEDELRNKRKAAELSSEVSSRPGEATALPSSVTLASVPSVVGPAAQIIGF